MSFLDRVRTADYHRGQGKLQLGFMLERKGFFEESIRQYRLAEGKAKPMAFFNIAGSFWNRRMPDSTIYYCNDLIVMLENLKPDSTMVPIFIILCQAYDSKEVPDSATSCYLSMRSLGLTPQRSETAAWINRMNQLSARYNQLLGQNPRDDKVLQFFLRYYTIKQDRQSIDRVYRHILAGEFDSEAWMTFLRFAVICDHRKYL
ncbi:hypothetical protein ACFL4P_02565 [Gemmatimonadota bacterium]